MYTKEDLKATIRYRDCWLSPDGEYYDGDAHENRAVDILQALYGVNYDEVDEFIDAGSLLERLGWVRLSATAMWEVRMEHRYWEDKEVTQAQLNAIWDWCEIHKKRFPFEYV